MMMVIVTLFVSMVVTEPQEAFVCEIVIKRGRERCSHCGGISTWKGRHGLPKLASVVTKLGGLYGKPQKYSGQF